MRRRSDTGVWWASPHLAGFLALVPTVVGIFLIIHELTLHDVIGGVTLQQGGVNFASSVALSKGQLPYENFALTQPPGMSILLLPFAWAAHTNGSTALDAARGLTAVVAVVDVFLVAYMARFHGIASTIVAGVLFATFPNAFYATSSVMLEPYLLLLCLLAFQAAFVQGELAAGGRLVLAGALVGVAIAIKPWAIIPAIVLLACGAVRWRQALARLVGGLVIGIGVPCIFFLLASPSAFIRDVVQAELSTGSGHGAPTGLKGRLAEILGLGSPLGLSHPGDLAVGIGALLVVVIIATVASHVSTSTMLDWALLATVVGLSAIAIVPQHLPEAYTYFLAGFALVLIGNCVGSLLAVLASFPVGSGDLTSTTAGGMTIVCVAAMIAVVSVGVPKETSFWRSYFLANGTNPAKVIDAAVPNGACVVSNNPEALIIADRFASLPPGCPFVVDPGGIGALAPTPAASVASWESLLSQARYLVIAPGPPKILLSAALQAYVGRRFSILHDAQYQIYLSNSTSTP
ncbi:MAG: glycosyltransferase 87 family protein [Actinomycetota bacterium]|nr:glycosyltransferase 87 family protein [Actinomycetota bacterium]